MQQRIFALTFHVEVMSDITYILCTIRNSGTLERGKRNIGAFAKVANKAFKRPAVKDMQQELPNCNGRLSGWFMLLSS